MLKKIESTKVIQKIMIIVCHQLSVPALGLILYGINAIYKTKCYYKEAESKPHGTKQQHEKYNSGSTINSNPWFQFSYNNKDSKVLS